MSDDLAALQTKYIALLEAHVALLRQPPPVTAPWTPAMQPWSPNVIAYGSAPTLTPYINPATLPLHPLNQYPIPEATKTATERWRSNEQPLAAGGWIHAKAGDLLRDETGGALVMPPPVPPPAVPAQDGPAPWTVIETPSLSSVKRRADKA